MPNRSKTDFLHQSDEGAWRTERTSGNYGKRGFAPTLYPEILYPELKKLLFKKEKKYGKFLDNGFAIC